MQCHFSSWTLFKPFLPLMYLIGRADQRRRGVSESVLQRDITRYKAKNPESSEEDVMRNILKHTVPKSLPGTSGYHHRNLQDLLCMVHDLGLPTLFVTLTADEVSEFKWQSITDLESVVKDFNDDFQFTVRPA